MHLRVTGSYQLFMGHCCQLDSLYAASELPPWNFVSVNTRSGDKDDYSIGAGITSVTRGCCYTFSGIHM